MRTWWIVQKLQLKKVKISENISRKSEGAEANSLSHVAATALICQKRFSSRGRRAISFAREVIFLIDRGNFYFQELVAASSSSPGLQLSINIHADFHFSSPHNPMPSSFASTEPSHRATKCQSPWKSSFPQALELQLYWLVAFSSRQTRESSWSRNIWLGRERKKQYPKIEMWDYAIKSIFSTHFLLLQRDRRKSRVLILEPLMPQIVNGNNVFDFSMESWNIRKCSYRWSEF